ncbi:uncharacterized protein LOC129588611 [Paramacrobiotus metropolitanus]|uniref:uncharacterized protein LOC129588611 n=1 Tax=Paramacrobiotus metropolitanus TaxID=2943436 RepID=UPI002445ED3C|nr:uncharacterized protein LOC129588611 [Paramacrobiotus metropolitanus]
MPIDPPIRYPRLLNLISTTEYVMGLVFLPMFGCGVLVGYLRGYLRHWSWEKWSETVLEFANYGILITAGRYGCRAQNPPIGKELHHFYLDFLSWNTVGAIISVLQIIIQTVEISWPDNDEYTTALPETDQAVKNLLIIASSIAMVLILFVQMAAVSLDLIKWTSCEKRTLWCSDQIGMRVAEWYRNVSWRVYPAWRSGFSRLSIASTCPAVPTTAQTSLTVASSDVLEVET